MTPDELRRAADLSRCGYDRYSLIRHLTARPRERRRILWVMLNRAGPTTRRSTTRRFGGSATSRSASATTNAKSSTSSRCAPQSRVPYSPPGTA